MEFADLGLHKQKTTQNHKGQQDILTNKMSSGRSYGEWQIRQKGGWAYDAKTVGDGNIWKAQKYTAGKLIQIIDEEYMAVDI